MTPDPRPGVRTFRRPPGATVLRHVVDGAAAPVAFFLLNGPAGPRWAALAALAVAVLVGLVRRHRGEPLAVVAVSTAIVAVHSASAIAVGEGRAFYLPELVLNVVGVAACAGSLLLARPLTGVVGRRLGVESAGWRTDPSCARRHRRLTWGWTALWLVHLVPLVWLYGTGSVGGLTALSAVNKPTVLAMVVLTAVVVRRGHAVDGATDPVEPTPYPAPVSDPTAEGAPR